MEGEIFLNDEGLLEGIPKKIIEKNPFRCAERILSSYT
jgi:hypothetical protein